MIPKPEIKDSKLRFRSNLTPLVKSAITKLVQHHMAHPSWGVKDVHVFHRDGRGWFGIGYNYWIAFDGTIYIGRGLNQGAHTAGYNTTALGIGYQGDFNYQKMTDAQLKSGIMLNAWLGKKLDLDLKDIVGHYDLGPSSCPAKNFRMAELRDGISNYIEELESKIVTPPVSGLFRVRLDPKDANSQLGAYSIYDNALELAERRNAYILDGNFEVIFPEIPKQEEAPKEEKDIFELARTFVMENKISDGNNPKNHAERDQVWVMLYNFFNNLKK